MSYIDQTLMPDEEVIYRTKPHWIIFTASVGWLFLAVLILFLAPRYNIANIYFYGRYTITDFLGFIALIDAVF